jgi:hypothetical protein
MGYLCALAEGYFVAASVMRDRVPASPTLNAVSQLSLVSTARKCGHTGLRIRAIRAAQDAGLNVAEEFDPGPEAA